MTDKKKGIIAEFKEFINRGNVMDMAVGVIIGGAFTGIVNSLVTDILQPLLNSVGGSPEIKGLAFYLNGQEINFGAFISAIISFLITAIAVFAIVKAMNEAAHIKERAAEKVGLAKAAEEAAKPAPRVCPFCKSEIADDATRCPNCTSKLEGYDNPVE
ncbi:large conductance mechanosensitive channel protein MscL [Collinsella provencensis]|uniref:large conductance mechanosensitive channel protein MscL n=1 Tax=Collinsella provencensis TaxID=1937461 RepID=UPI000C8672E1|nr:large conductance mechanosensitive channel protein MscL [Collinsella provencensis]